MMPGLLDVMGPTPRKNKFMGLLADALAVANDYATQMDPRYASKRQNQTLGLLADAVSLGSLAKTADRLSYGESLTNAGKANVPFLKPETADVAMLGAVSPRNALAAMGMVGGMADNGAMRAATVIGARGGAQNMTPMELKSLLLEQYKRLAADSPYSHFGVRVIGPDQPAQVGKSLPRSSKWVDGRPLSTKLPGTAVFELRQRDAESAIDHALAYNLGVNGQKVALVQGDELGRNMMPEPFSALIKSPVVTHIYDRPSELSGVTRADEVRKLLSILERNGAPLGK